MPADVFFVAGEPSGDLQAALLARAMRELRPNLSFAGTGGDAMRAAGVRVMIDSLEFASIGPISVLLKAPALYAAYISIYETLRAHPPRLFVPIDSGAINLRLLARLRGRGYRGDAVYYFPPAAWLDSTDTAKRTAAMATPLTAFEHQRDFYRSLGLPIEYFGHPLLSVISARAPRVAKRDGINIAVLPGSRAEEIARHLPVVARAARIASDSLAARFTIVAASAARERQIRSGWARHGGPDQLHITTGRVPDVITEADVAWTASGTAVLETALRGVPQVAYYAVSPLQYRIAQRRIPQIVAGYLTLPNIIVGRRVVEELKQHAFTPERLIDATRVLLEDARARDDQLAGYADLRARLGPPDALTRIALYMINRLEGRTDELPR